MSITTFFKLILNFTYQTKLCNVWSSVCMKSHTVPKQYHSDLKDICKTFFPQNESVLVLINESMSVRNPQHCFSESTHTVLQQFHYLTSLESQSCCLFDKVWHAQALYDRTLRSRWIPISSHAVCTLVRYADKNFYRLIQYERLVWFLPLTSAACQLPSISTLISCVLCHGGLRLCRFPPNQIKYSLINRRRNHLVYF